MSSSVVRASTSTLRSLSLILSEMVFVSFSIETKKASRAVSVSPCTVDPLAIHPGNHNRKFHAILSLRTLLAARSLYECFDNRALILFRAAQVAGRSAFEGRGGAGFQRQLGGQFLAGN